MEKPITRPLLATSLSMRRRNELHCWSGTALPLTTTTTSAWKKHAANVCG